LLPSILPLGLQILQPPQLRYIHASVFGFPFVIARIAVGVHCLDTSQKADLRRRYCEYSSAVLSGFAEKRSDDFGQIAAARYSDADNFTLLKHGPVHF
jgi:hypothetical protein